MMIHPTPREEPRFAAVTDPTFQDAEEEGDRIATLVRQQRMQRSLFFGTNLPYSWVRILMAIASYCLLLTDVPRSGLGVRNLDAIATRIQPNVYQFAGPWHYSVVALHSNDTTPEAASVWAYKFDTTSISLRAFAEFYGLEAFPQCLFYDQICPSAFNATTVFGMIDSLAEAAAQRPGPRLSPADPVAVTLRTRANFWDRLHRYLLQQLFMRALWRSAKATYYPPAATEDPAFRICHRRAATPLACDELWVNYRRSCPQNKPECQVGGTIWDHISERLRALQSIYPTNSIDLTIIDGIDDIMVNKGGFSYVGRRNVDLSTITRVRDCAEDATCSTVFLEDYRYETATTMTDGEEWYSVVLLLRFFGQNYFYLRVIGLLWSCYTTREGDDDVGTSVWSKMSAALKLLIRLPSQTVVYGCPLPVLCYALAHSIDSPITYEIVYQKYTTMMGSLHMNFQDFAVLTAIQMRSVWIFALVPYALVLGTTSRSWIPVQGVVGAPEFVLAGMSSFTIFSQYRSLGFRNTDVIEISELPGWRKHASWPRDYTPSRANINTFADGVLIDVKCFLCEAAVIAILWSLWCVLLMFSLLKRRARPMTKETRRREKKEK